MITLNGSRVIVTGGAGFIGSELVRQLIARGAKVTVIDNLVNGRRENLAGLPAQKVQLVVADIRHAERMQKLLKGADLVYHLACLGVRHSIHSPVENHQVNALGTLNLLIAARKNKVPRFVYVSSSEVYGSARSVPMDEEHPALPITVYGGSKMAGECYTRAYYHTYGYPAVVVRPFNAYGPRSHHESDSGEVIPKFMLRCMAGIPMTIFGDGRQTRDFTYVGDTARGILTAGLCQEALGRILNIGQGRETKIKDLAQKVRKILGKPDAPLKHDRPRPGDVLRLYSDTRLARRMIGFKPTISLEQGLLLLRDWYLESGQSPEELLKEERLHNWNLPPGTKLRRDRKGRS